MSVPHQEKMSVLRNAAPFVVALPSWTPEQAPLCGKPSCCQTTMGRLEVTLEQPYGEAVLPLILGETLFT